jgi:ABC-type Fe3+-hydroxamate transport system substrate-binding protein
MKTFLLLLMPACFALLTGACDRSPPTTDGSSKRVVALSPAVAIILSDLGDEQSIVGRHGFDLVLNPELPVCGDQTGINYERLLAINPTHVITEWGAGGPPEQLKKLCADRFWKLHDSTLRSPEDIEREVTLLGEFVGVDRRAVSDTQRRIRSAWAQEESLATAGRVLMLADVAQPAALGPGSFHHEILLRIGCVPALTDGGPYQYLSLEQVKDINPDVIVLVLPRAPMEPDRPLSGDELIKVLGRIGELELDCVRNRRVVLIDDPGALTPSTAMIGFAEELKTFLRDAK